MSEIRKLIGEEKWAELQKKNKRLDEMDYVCVCETCGKLFFRESLAKVQQMMLDEIWIPSMPMMWYVDACKHWIPQMYHAVRIYVSSYPDKTLVKDLSAEWSREAKLQLSCLPPGVTAELALQNEISNLEKRIRRLTR